MRKLLTVMMLLTFAASAFAQTPENHLSGGSDEASRAAIQNFKSTPIVQGFRICLYIGSEQDARLQAKETLELCYTTFPEIEGEIVYEAPIFKVLVGTCMDRIEATRLLARLIGTFPKAFVMSGSIPVTDFLHKEQPDSVETAPGGGRLILPLN